MAHLLQAVHKHHTAQHSILYDTLHAQGVVTRDAVTQCRLIEVEYAEIEDRKVRGQLQNVGAIERQVRFGDASSVTILHPAVLLAQWVCVSPFPASTVSWSSCNHHALFAY